MHSTGPSRRSLAVAAHELLHASQGLFDLLIGRGIAGTHKALAAGAEGVARHNSDMLLFKELLAEGLIVHAGGGDVGEGIEGAARLEGLEAEAVESRDHQAAAPVVFGNHALHMLLADG